MGLPHKQKENLYPLVTISGNPILYKDSIIYLKTGPIKVTIKRQKIVISFDVLLLSKNKAVLRMLFLQEFNLRINWITEIIEIKNT